MVLSKIAAIDVSNPSMDVAHWTVKLSERANWAHLFTCIYLRALIAFGALLFDFGLFDYRFNYIRPLVFISPGVPFGILEDVPGTRLKCSLGKIEAKKAVRYSIVPLLSLKFCPPEEPLLKLINEPLSLKQWISWFKLVDDGWWSWSRYHSKTNDGFLKFFTVFRGFSKLIMLIVLNLFQNKCKLHCSKIKNCP